MEDAGQGPSGSRKTRGGTRPARRSRQFQSAHRSAAGRELVGLDPQPLEHRDEQVRQRIVVLGVERQVLAVPEPAAGQQHRQVDVRVASWRCPCRCRTAPSSGRAASRRPPGSRERLWRNPARASNCPSSFDRNSASTSGRLPWWVMLWITVVSMNSDTIRDESVSRASLIMSNITRVLATNSRASSMSCGGGTETFGLGRCSHASADCKRCSRSRTEVKYWSSRCRSAASSDRFSRLDCSPTKSSVLRPCRRASTAAATSSGLPWTNSFSNSFRGLRSDGIGAPLRVKLSVPPSFPTAEHQRRVAGPVAHLLRGELVERNPVAEAAALGMRRAGEEALLGRVARPSPPDG